MTFTDFVKLTVRNLEPRFFDELKTVLLNEYLTFSEVPPEEITCTVLCEKLDDYFEKIEFRTGRNFDKLLDRYASDLDSVVENRIYREPKPHKGAPIPPPSRARKYYDKAVEIRKGIHSHTPSLLDYSRLMLCLYTATVINDQKPIKNFDYSLECLNLSRILDALKSERSSISKKIRFDTKDPYNSDRSTFVILIMLFYYFKNTEITEDT